MSLSCPLSDEDRQLVRDIVSGLDNRAEKHREYARVRSIVCRMDAAYRLADNASQAASGRKRYHGDIVESRRKAVEKARARRRSKKEATHEWMALSNSGVRSKA